MSENNTHAIKLEPFFGLEFYFEVLFFKSEPFPNCHQTALLIWNKYLTRTAEKYLFHTPVFGSSVPEEVDVLLEDINFQITNTPTNLPSSPQANPLISLFDNLLHFIYTALGFSKKIIPPHLGSNNEPPRPQTPLPDPQKKISDTKNKKTPAPIVPTNNPSPVASQPANAPLQPVPAKKSTPKLFSKAPRLSDRPPINNPFLESSSPSPTSMDMSSPIRRTEIADPFATNDGKDALGSPREQIPRAGPPTSGRVSQPTGNKFLKPLKESDKVKPNVALKGSWPSLSTESSTIKKLKPFTRVLTMTLFGPKQQVNELSSLIFNSSPGVPNYFVHENAQCLIQVNHFVTHCHHFLSTVHLYNPGLVVHVSAGNVLEQQKKWSLFSELSHCPYLLVQFPDPAAKKSLAEQTPLEPKRNLKGHVIFDKAHTIAQRQEKFLSLINNVFKEPSFQKHMHEVPPYSEVFFEKFLAYRQTNKISTSKKLVDLYYRAIFSFERVNPDYLSTEGRGRQVSESTATPSSAGSNSPSPSLDKQRFFTVCHPDTAKKTKKLIYNENWTVGMF